MRTRVGGNTPDIPPEDISDREVAPRRCVATPNELQLQSAVTAYFAACKASKRSKPLSLNDWWATKGKRCVGYSLVKYRTLSRRVTAARDNGGTVVPRQSMGGMFALTETEEQELVVILNKHLAQHGVLYPWLISLEAQMFVCRKAQGSDMDMKTFLAKFKRVGGKKWRAGLVARHPEFKREKKKRALDKHRAMKRQPEWTATHYRAVAYASALIMIQERIESGTAVDGWVLASNEGTVKRDKGDGPLAETNDWGPDVLGVAEVNGIAQLVVVPLNKELLRLPELLVNGDEKPFNPDTTSLTTIGTVMARQNSGNWTATPFMLRDEMVLATLILRGVSVSIDAANVAANCKVAIGLSASPNGFTSDSLFRSTLVDEGGLFEKLREKGLSRSKPALLILDGHGSRLQRDLMVDSAKASVYIVVMPSHTSTELQPCDNGLMSALDRKYGQRYALRLATDPRAAITDTDCVEMLMRTLEDLAASKAIMEGSWTRVGLVGDKIDLRGIHPAAFRAGAPFREDDATKRLPVTQWLLDQLFHPRNLCLRPDSDHIVHVSEKRERKEKSIREAEKGARKLFESLDSVHMDDDSGIVKYMLRRTESEHSSFYTLSSQTLLQRTASLTSILADEDDDSDAMDTEEPPVGVSGVVRGACGRVSTASGAMLFTASIMEQAAEIAKRNREKEAEKKRRTDAKVDQAIRENPLVRILHSLGMLESRDTVPTKAHLITFMVDNDIDHTKSMKRDDMVTMLLQELGKGGDREWKGTSAEGESIAIVGEKRKRVPFGSPQTHKTVRRSKRQKRVG